MSLQTWQETLIAAQADGTALTNTTTATSITPATGLVTLPAQYFQIGRAHRLRATGRMSTVVTTPGTLTLQLRFGAINVFDGGAMTLNVVAQTNVPWILDVLLTCRAIGSGTSAQLFSQGLFTSHAVIGSPAPTAGGAGSHVLPYNAAPAVGGGFDSTAAQTPTLFATWSVANAANSIQVHQMILESLN